MLSTSFKFDKDVFNNPPDFIPSPFTIMNYVNQLTDFDGFLIYFKNGLIVSTSAAIISIFVSTLAAYSFSRFQFTGKRSILLLILTTQMFPMVVIAISLYVIYAKLNLLDTYFGLVIGLTTFALPFSIFMLKGFFDAIPKDMEEAAYVDGCSKLKTLVKIVIPMASPGIIAVGLFSFLVSWNNLLFPLTLTSRLHLRTIPPGFLQTYVSQYQYFWADMSAGSVLVSLPLVIVFIILQKYLVSGLTAGAIKA